MKFSLKWIKQHIEGELPELATLASTLSAKALEVESVEGDLLDIKILPHRAHDVMSHRGLAREFVTLFNLKRKEMHFEALPKTEKTFPITITDDTRCFRYIGAVVSGIKVGPSPVWVQEKLESIGQRSISNIVDITNFVLHDMGQPMHAFDAAKVVGGITVRVAVSGEKMTTLDGKELTLTGTETVIADDEGVLALAGVKGGMKAIVDEKTTSIIFESANFNPTMTRRASDKHGIRTDSSKRYEQGITSAFAEEAACEALAILKEQLPGATIEVIADVYPKKEEVSIVQVTKEDINGLLGSVYDEKTIEDTFARLGFSFSKEGGVYHVEAPEERLDIRIKQDVVEEVGRVLGYDALPAVLPALPRKGLPHKRLFYETKIKNILLENGFSEIYTYTFGDKGEVEIMKGLASDKEKLRTNLGEGVKKALEMNLRNAPLLGIDTVKVFEFGTVFTKDTEVRHFALALDDGKKKTSFTEEVDLIMSQIKRTLGVGQLEYDTVSPKPYVIELDFDTLISTLPEPENYDPLITPSNIPPYQTVSPYPFIVRDIAVWTPLGTTWESLLALSLQINDPRIVRTACFDTFTKEIDGVQKTSFAFRFVIQSFEKTMTDVEANEIADKMYSLLKEKGYEIR